MVNVLPDKNQTCYKKEGVDDYGAAFSFAVCNRLGNEGIFDPLFGFEIFGGEFYLFFKYFLVLFFKLRVQVIGNISGDDYDGDYKNI